MEPAAKQYLDYLRALTVLLREAGATEYITPALTLRLGALPVEVKSDEEPKPAAPVQGGYHHPSLWSDGKPPAFPKG